MSTPPSKPAASLGVLAAMKQRAAQAKQRQQMAQFLGAAKKQKVDRHSLLASAMLEPVEAW